MTQRIDADYFKERMSYLEEAIEAKVDEWLKDKVLPNHFLIEWHDIPNFVSNKKLKTILEDRGFQVSFCGAYGSERIRISF